MTQAPRAAAVIGTCPAPLPWEGWIQGAALAFAHGWALLFASIAVLLPMLIEVGVTIEVKVSPIYALTYPIVALIICWMLIRSTTVTLWQGGVTWRETFYPLEELKKRSV